MFHCDIDLVQIEIQLQHRAAVTGDCSAQNAGLPGNKLILIFLGLRLISICSIDCCISLSLTGSCQGIIHGVAYTVIVLIIEFNSVIDINCFPLRIQRMVLRSVADKMLIGCDMSGYITIIFIRAILIFQPEVR